VRWRSGFNAVFAENAEVAEKGMRGAAGVGPASNARGQGAMKRRGRSAPEAHQIFSALSVFSANSVFVQACDPHRPYRFNSGPLFPVESLRPVDADRAQCLFDSPARRGLPQS
jgi:hypothetical protein